jgi:hypothetical protein
MDNNKYIRECHKISVNYNRISVNYHRTTGESGEGRSESDSAGKT